MTRRRDLIGCALAAPLASVTGVHARSVLDARHDPALRVRVYTAALTLARRNIRGGPDNPTYTRPFVDAAFSTNIFYWDTCIIAAYAKYHQDELPIANALDNFYARIDDDGHICREFLGDGTPMWPKEHPVSVNPPLLAFAELELHSIRANLPRLRRVYPLLQRHFNYLHRRFGMPDGLYFSDAFGSGMDNIPRYPEGWSDDGQGIPLRELHPELFVYDGLSPLWNRQGRSVDFSAQMALFAEQLASIAALIDRRADIPALQGVRAGIVSALNRYCWSEPDGCYYDLGYGQLIRRMHVGMFWTLMAGVATTARADRLIGHLTNPAKFWRAIPVASYPADQPGFAPEGNYWLGSVWAPTNYMVLRGLKRYGRIQLARQLAGLYWSAVVEVFVRDGTFYENYAPDTIAKGSQARPDFCGWTAIAPIAVSREWLWPQTAHARA